jgi:LysM repeat protein
MGNGGVAENTEQRFSALKKKYESVLRTIEQQGVHLTNLHVENDKLLIRGQAPTQEAKNRVWDQIKVVDPNFSSDFVADITVDPSASPVAQRTDAAAGQTYTVKPGDTLSKIAQHFYGSSSEYMKIFNANRDKLIDPNKIFPGQDLIIPA